MLPKDSAQPFPPQPILPEDREARFKIALSSAGFLEDALQYVAPITGLTPANFITIGKIHKAAAHDRTHLNFELANQSTIITSGRVGACQPIFYETGLSTGSQMSYRCACGAEDTMILSSFIRKLTGRGHNRYFAPFEEEGGKTRHLCHHIDRELRAAYPYLWNAWLAVRKSVANATAINKIVKTNKEWFRRDIGLLRFIEDVGLPPTDAHVLRKKEADSFLPDAFIWVPPIAAGKRSDIRRALALRFYATNKLAKSKGRRMYWEDSRDFVDAVLEKAPKKFNLSDYRLKWINAAEEGYGRDNFKWVKTSRVGKLSQQEKKRQDGFCNFAGHLVEPDTFALCHIRMMEIILENDFVGSVEDALQRVLLEFNFVQNIGD